MQNSYSIWCYCLFGSCLSKIFLWPILIFYLRMFPGKTPGAPLDFRCIKGAGGKVPRTLIGITRIYPILFKER